MPLEPSIHEGIAAALFVPAWADYQDALGDEGEHPGGGGDWMDIAPEAPYEATQAAIAFANQLARLNNEGNIIGLLMKAARADGVSGSDLDDSYAYDFGWYMTMSSIGHGVSWEDSHEDFDAETPYIDANYDGEELHLEGIKRFNPAKGRRNASAPRITTTYAISTPESREQSSYEETGFIDEEGVEMVPDLWEEEDPDIDTSPASMAVAFLDTVGPLEPSATSFHKGVWYTNNKHGHGTRDYFEKGTEESRSYHLEGFTEAQEREVFKKVAKRGNPGKRYEVRYRNRWGTDERADWHDDFDDAVDNAHALWDRGISDLTWVTDQEKGTAKVYIIDADGKVRKRR